MRCKKHQSHQTKDQAIQAFAEHRVSNDYNAYWDGQDEPNIWIHLKSRKVAVSYLSSPLRSKYEGASGASARVWAGYVSVRLSRGGPPPTLRFPPGPPLKPGLQHRRTTRKRQQPHMHFHPPRLHTSPPQPQPKSRPALKLDNVRLLKNFVSFTLTTAMNNVVARTLRRTALQ